MQTNNFEETLKNNEDKNVVDRNLHNNSKQNVDLAKTDITDANSKNNLFRKRHGALYKFFSRIGVIRTRGAKRYKRLKRLERKMEQINLNNAKQITDISKQQSQFWIKNQKNIKNNVSNVNLANVYQNKSLGI